MNGPVQEYSYDLTGYDYRPALNIVAARIFPAWARLWTHAFWAILTVFGLRIAGAAAGPLQVPALWLYIGYAAFVAASFLIGLKANRMRMAAYAAAPSRTGQVRLRLDDDGLHQETPALRSTYEWTHLADALPGRDGLLVLIGPGEVLPIPATAFSGPEEQAQVLADLKRRIGARQGASA